MLSENEWQVQCLVEARFPGYTFEIRKLYWDMVDNRDARFTLEEIVSRLDYFQLDLTDTKIAEPSPKQVKSHPIPHEAAVSWLKLVTDYEEALFKRKAAEIDQIFRKAIGLPIIDNVKPKTDLTGREQPQYELWLRFARWTPEEAVEFSLAGRPEPEFMNRLSELIDKSGLDLDFLVPCDFILWAKETGWKLEIGFQGVQALDPSQISLLQAKRKKSYEKIILGVANDKFGYSDTSNNQDKAKQIAEAVERGGFSINQTTVANILRELDDLLKD